MPRRRKRPRASSSHGPLQGMLLAVSMLSESSSSSKQETLTYNSVVAECRAAGAQVTGHVHGRVDALVASPPAIDQCTGRVRKAVQRGVDIVDIAWVRASVAAGRAVERGQHLQQPSVLPVTKDATTATSKSQEQVESTATSIELGCCCACHENDTVADCRWCIECRTDAPVTVDLGCCCVCHDHTSEATDCRWCVECSVNLAKQSPRDEPDQKRQRHQ